MKRVLCVLWQKVVIIFRIKLRTLICLQLNELVVVLYLVSLKSIFFLINPYVEFFYLQALADSFKALPASSKKYLCDQTLPQTVAHRHICQPCDVSFILNTASYSHSFV